MYHLTAIQKGVHFAPTSWRDECQFAKGNDFLPFLWFFWLAKQSNQQEAEWQEEIKFNIMRMCTDPA